MITSSHQHKNEIRKSKGLYACFVISFTTNIGFAIVIPTIAFYLDKLGETDTMWAGIATSAFALGQIIASPILGKVCDSNNITGVLAAALVMGILGDVLYAMSSNLWELIVSRFLTGLGAGNQAVLQAFIISVSPIDLRSKRMSQLALANTISAAVGPVSHAAIAMGLSGVSFHLFGDMEVDMYTAPGYISAIFGIINLLLVVVSVRDRSKVLLKSDHLFETLANNDVLEIDEETEEFIPLLQRSTVTISSRSDAMRGLSRISKLGSYQAVSRTLPILAVVVYTHFAIVTSNTMLTTLLTPEIQHNYQWGYSESAALWLTMAILSVVSFVIHTRIRDSVLKDYIALGLGVFLMALGWAVVIVRQPQAQIPLWRFRLGTALTALGVPWAVASSYAIFSKVLGNIEQGGPFGLLVASGSLAFLISPLWGSLLYNTSQGYILFPVLAAMLLLANILNLVIYNRSKYYIWLNSLGSESSYKA